MATDITIRAGATQRNEQAVGGAARKAMDVFSLVDTTCTRFDDDSPLMRANAAPSRWHDVPPSCFAALLEAHGAYEATEGRFDPRVLADLVRIGYGASMSGGVPPTQAASDAGRRRDPLPRWQPKFRFGSGRVLLGGLPVDLGGIGKGLAIRWAAQQLRAATGDFLVEAGGDCYCAGEGPDGGPWRIAVEDPAGAPGPVLVLGLSDLACATSSVRVRHWRVAGELVHHLIDPATGRPGGQGLQAVTVVDDDTMRAEVWSKTLFLAGPAAIAALAEEHGLAVAWIDDAGRTLLSAAMPQHVIWPAA